MADPVVHLSNGVPDSGTGNITTLGAVVAKQPALGTAGAASADVITVQGVASMTALKVDGSAVTQPVSGTVTVTNYGAAFTRAAGASDANTQRVTIDSGQLGSLGQQTMAASAPVALATDQSAIPTYPRVPATSSGTTSSRVVASASSNTATNLKASAGNLVNIDVFNVAAYSVFLKFYNKASSPTVGTDTPVLTIPIAAGTGYARTFPTGKPFATGLSYGITKLQADSDTTALTASDLTGAIDWI